MLTKKIFKPYKRLIKAGVILHKLQSNQYKQNIIFSDRDIQKDLHLEKLNNIIDHINNRNRRDTLSWGSSTIEKDWSQRREKLSHFKSTQIENIPTVFAN